MTLLVLHKGWLVCGANPKVICQNGLFLC